MAPHNTPTITHYDWRGGREAMLRFGPSGGPVVVVALPLFEEANRTRAFALTICRALADRGIASALPDLPGQGESASELSTVTLADMREAFASASKALGRPHTIAIRGGALVTLQARRASSWLFAPVDGRSLVRDLDRVRRIASPGSPSLIDLAHTTPAGTLAEAAGNELSSDLLHELVNAIPDRTTPNRVVRLEGTDGQADTCYPGAPLWRRSEPDVDAVLAAALAQDIAAWITSCAA